MVRNTFQRHLAACAECKGKPGLCEVGAFLKRAEDKRTHRDPFRPGTVFKPMSGGDSTPVPRYGRESF